MIAYAKLVFSAFACDGHGLLAGFRGAILGFCRKGRSRSAQRCQSTMLLVSSYVCQEKNLRVDWVDPSAQAIARVNVSDLFLTGVDLFTDRQTVPRIGKVIDKVSDSVRTKSGNKQRMIRDRS